MFIALGVFIVLFGLSVVHNFILNDENNVKEQQKRDLRRELDDGERTRARLENNIYALRETVQTLNTRLDVSEKQIDQDRITKTTLKDDLAAQTERVVKMENQMADIMLELEQYQSQHDETCNQPKFK